MCGIHCVIRLGASTETDATTCSLDVAVKRSLDRRGPDHFGTVETRVEDAMLSFTSTVLSLRGATVTPQPFKHTQSGSILCWNGEAWRIGDHTVQGNDGADLFNALTSRLAQSPAEAEECVLETLRAIEGPFAFVFFDRPSRKLYFGRDRLGRRSLVISRDASDGTRILSSIAQSANGSWQEVEADGIYCLDLGLSSQGSSLVRHAWTIGVTDECISGIGSFNISVPEVTQDKPLAGREQDAVAYLREHLTDSLSLRVLNVPNPPAVALETMDIDTRVAILFSGGLDCSVIARLCHDLIPAEQGIDLLNVAFENPRLAAAQAKTGRNAEEALEDLYEACPDRQTGRKSFAELAQVCPGRAWRFVAINVPYTETTAHRDQVVSLIHPHNTEMDLAIAYALYFASRGQGISFKSGPDADLVSASAHTKYATPARILLSGLGADELFGGYVRHATAYSRLGYPGLLAELKLDVGRLGKRNLGRDDRVMANWGREVRFPFLDERLVKWAIELPVWQKCDFGRQDVDGDAIEPGKRVLRLLAAEMGMLNAAREKKRAIQFGSRTAKMESGKVKGTMLIS